MSDPVTATAATSAAAPASPPPPKGPLLWSHGTFSFKDILDIVNPLQHLPVIGSIYRYLTGDEPSGGARIIGDALYGGPIGFGTGVVSAMLTDSDGRDLGERILAGVFGPTSSSTTVGTPKAAGAAQPAQAAAASGPPTNLAPANPQLFHAPRPNVVAQPQRPLNPPAQLGQAPSGTRVANGQTVNGRPVPLELSTNLLTITKPNPPPQRPTNLAASAAGGSGSAPTDPPNPIAQRMLDALDKYEQLKKKQEQEDSAKQGAGSGVDLSL